MMRYKNDEIVPIQDCPLCDKKHEHMFKYVNSFYIDVVCDFYGAVSISDKVLQILSSNSQVKKQIIQLLNEKNIKDRLEFGIPYDVIVEGKDKNALLTKKILLIANKNDKIEEQTCPQYILDDFLDNYPKTVTDKLNRALCNIARKGALNNTLTEYTSVKSEDFWSGAKTEAQYFINMLVDAGLCKHNSLLTSGKTVPLLLLTLEGWQKFEELERNWQNSNTAFVAMWFSKEHTQNYRNAAEDAIRQAGYEPKIIDTHEHNNFIMDEVINQINEAKFVIADFTCIPEQPEKNSKILGGVRGGVYFEAGYAKGLGKEVIVTCKDDADSKKRRHFDIDQLNTLFWNEKDGKLYDSNGNDFIHRLSERIKATVGKGKLIL